MADEEVNAAEQDDAEVEAQLFELVNQDSEDSEEDDSSITTLEDAKKALKKVRREAAARRTKNKGLEDEAKKWREYQDSQKTELERLAEAKAEAEQRVAALELENIRHSIVSEYELPKELTELLSGSEDEMREKAKLLKSAVGTKSNGKPDFYAGQRGKPVAANAETPNEWFAKAWKEAGTKTNITFK